MNKILILSLLLLVTLPPQSLLAAKKPGVTTKVCKTVDAKLQRLRSQLLQGGKVARMEQLKSRQRQLQRLRYQCWQRRLSTS